MSKSAPDGQGRTLKQNLDALGLTPPEYLHTLWFADAAPYTGRCRRNGVAAVTKPGSRVVLLCAEPFEAVVFRRCR